MQGTTYSLLVKMDGNGIKMGVSTRFRGRRTSCRKKWVKWDWNEIHKAVGVQFKSRERTTCGKSQINVTVRTQSRHTSYEREGAEIRSILLSMLFQEVTHSLWVRMSGKINMAGDNALPVSENEIDIHGSVQFRIRRTNWAELRSIWLSVLNSGDDTRPVGENGKK